MRPSASHPYWKKDSSTILGEHLPSPGSAIPESRPPKTERTMKETSRGRASQKHE